MSRLFAEMRAMTPVREVTPGRYKLRWKPIRHRGLNESGTWNVYVSRFAGSYRWLGFLLHRHSYDNYGYSHDVFEVTLRLWWFEMEFWISWNYTVDEDGPSDRGFDDEPWVMDVSKARKLGS